jgi:hypothetical protein
MPPLFEEAEKVLANLPGRERHGTPLFERWIEDWVSCDRRDLKGLPNAVGVLSRL